MSFSNERFVWYSWDGSETNVYILSYTSPILTLKGNKQYIYFTPVSLRYNFFIIPLVIFEDLYGKHVTLNMGI